MLVRSVGIRDIAEIENISINKVLSVLVKSNHKIKPKRNHYDKLKVDEFWTYVGLSEKLVASQKNFLTVLKHLIWLCLKNNSILCTTPPIFLISQISDFIINQT